MWPCGPGEVADSTAFSTQAGHQLVAELLLLLLARQIAPLLAGAPTPVALATAAVPSRARQDGRTRAGVGGHLAGHGVAPVPRVRWSDTNPLVRQPPCLFGGGEARGSGETRGGTCAVSEAVAALLAEPGVRLSARMAWQPQAAMADDEAAGEAAGKADMLLAAALCLQAASPLL